VRNLNHPAETADVCALDGQHVAQSVVSWLVGSGWPSSGVPIQAQWPLSWVSPAWVSDAATPPRGRLVLRAETFRRAPRLRASQGERELWSGRVPWVVPTRPVTVPAGWLAGVARDIASPPVVLSLD